MSDTAAAASTLQALDTYIYYPLLHDCLNSEHLCFVPLHDLLIIISLENM